MSKPDDVSSVKTAKLKTNQLKDIPVQYVKGVGPRRAQLLERLGIKSLDDLLFYYPWRYWFLMPMFVLMVLI